MRPRLLRHKPKAEDEEEGHRDEKIDDKAPSRLLPRRVLIGADRCVLLRGKDCKEHAEKPEYDRGHHAYCWFLQNIETIIPHQDE
ncbi:MAG: hypothetical protein KKA90_00650 [Nanoarchaeota archaeon]|nr:hypothetical protein [Nanoarchaeota archaeon]